jgi:hypothetical protein
MNDLPTGCLIEPILLCLQVLSADEDATVPTCNLAETMHNKWLQASGNNMIDLYDVTLNDYCRAALQVMTTTPHRHDRVNFTMPKLGRHMTPGKVVTATDGPTCPSIRPLGPIRLLSVR